MSEPALTGPVENGRDSAGDPQVDPRANLLAAIDAVTAQPPLRGLGTLYMARKRMDQVQEELIVEARHTHLTWRQIADAMGSWATNVHRRYRHVDDGSREPRP